MKQFINKPEKFKVVNKALIYIAVQEIIVAVTAGVYLLVGKI